MATNQKAGSSSPPRAHHSLNLNDLFRVNFTGTVWRGNQKVGNSSSPGRATLLSSFRSLTPHFLLRLGRLLWVHWVQQRCFESGAQSQCPRFLLVVPTENAIRCEYL